MNWFAFEENVTVDVSVHFSKLAAASETTVHRAVWQKQVGVAEPVRDEQRGYLPAV